MEDINPKEFIILPDGDICLAKYKGIYYRHNYPLDEEQLKNPEVQKAIKQLDKYISKTKQLRN